MFEEKCIVRQGGIAVVTCLNPTGPERVSFQYGKDGVIQSVSVKDSTEEELLRLCRLKQFRLQPISFIIGFFEKMKWEVDWGKVSIEVGKRYRIVISDCCVGGEFSAVLSGWDEEEGELAFDNGVTLYEWNGCTFEEEMM